MTSLLVGDLGGTHLRCALAHVDNGRISLQREQRWLSSGVTRVGQLAATLHQAYPEAKSLCLAVAGPVDGNLHCRTTNLPWDIDAVQFTAGGDFTGCLLLNDLEAVAWGLPAVAEDQLLTLNPGISREGNRAVLAPGTGLGEAGLFWDGQRHQPFASEGSHADFAPASPVEERLLQWLRERHGHVSWERVVSGPGLQDLYRFFHETEEAPEPSRISELAESGSDPSARRALGLFFELLGAEAGNLALKLLCRNGLFLAGGILPRLAEPLTKSGFLERFVDKGRYRELLSEIPVRLVLDPAVALRGAALFHAATRNQ